MSVDVIHTGVARIACTSCVSNPTQSGIDVSGFIEDIHINEDEAVIAHIVRVNACVQHATNLYQEVEEAWITQSSLSSEERSRVEDFVKEYLLIAKTNDGDSSDTTKQMLHNLLQVSKFILFLEEQETNTAAYDSDNSKTTAQLAELRDRMRQLVCATRTVLQDFSDSDIMAAVKEKVRHTLSLAGVNNGDVQRVVCAYSLQTMIEELSAMKS